MRAVLYGLKNCDTCRKAAAWLKKSGFEVDVQDVREDRLSLAMLKTIVSAFGPETVVNRRSTTWRGLSDVEKSDLSEKKALVLLKAHPALMKRPVIQVGAVLTIGFDDGVKQTLGDAFS
ncbi:MAG: Spx/MgsR family RNA polymerase-binding regulatory protein [Pseudomonadota bacterium]